MNIFKKLEEGLNGMVLGVFCTLILGTVMQQVGMLIGGNIGQYVRLTGKVAVSVTGAGIGCGIAWKLKEGALVTISAAAVGMTGAFSNAILSGNIVANGVVTFKASPEPLGAFAAAFVGILIGHLLAGQTDFDIIITPVVTLVSGSVAGLFVGPFISIFIKKLEELLHFGASRETIIMGAVLSVLMALLFLLPVNAFAIAAVLGFTGLKAGAATVGACAAMIGFAVAAYQDNKIGGTIVQALGTGMFQFANIVKKPIICLPAILSAAILGSVSAQVLSMTNSSKGASLGACGLGGSISAYRTMIKTTGKMESLIIIALMHIVLPGIISYFAAQFMRKKKWIRPGDMKIDI